MKVYVWDQDSNNWGHASLELSDGTYISWWPKSSLKKDQKTGTKGEAVFELDGDISREEKHPENTFIIRKSLNEREMRNWWRQFMKTGTYSFLGQNCCWAVMEALKVGGAFQNIPPDVQLSRIVSRFVMNAAGRSVLPFGLSGITGMAAELFGLGGPAVNEDEPLVYTPGHVKEVIRVFRLESRN